MKREKKLSRTSSDIKFGEAQTESVIKDSSPKTALLSLFFSFFRFYEIRRLRIISRHPQKLDNRHRYRGSPYECWKSVSTDSGALHHSNEAFLEGYRGQPKTLTQVT